MEQHGNETNKNKNKFVNHNFFSHINQHASVIIKIISMQHAQNNLD